MLWAAIASSASSMPYSGELGGIGGDKSGSTVFDGCGRYRFTPSGTGIGGSGGTGYAVLVG